MKDDVKQLWEKCFDESERFVELYFEKRYQDDKNVALYSGKQMIAAVQAIDYNFNFFSKPTPMAYLSGICTHPDFRGQGKMSELMNKTHKKLYSEGVVFSSLIPANQKLAETYEKYGYVNIFKRTEIIFQKKQKAVKYCTFHKIFEENIDEAYLFYSKKMSEKEFCVQHDLEDFKIILEDINGTGGIIMAKSNELISGIAFYSLANEEINVWECICEIEEIKDELLSHILEIENKRYLKLYETKNNSNSINFGMLRIINVQKALDIYAIAKKNTSSSFCVEDLTLEDNQGVFRIKKGVCTRGKNKYLKKISISELTEFMLVGTNPKMSLMLSE